MKVMLDSDAFAPERAHKTECIDTPWKKENV